MPVGFTDTVTIRYSCTYGDVKETTHYFDGLGRPLQTVQRQITPAARLNMVTPVVAMLSAGKCINTCLITPVPVIPAMADSSCVSFHHRTLHFYQNIYSLPSSCPRPASRFTMAAKRSMRASPLNRATDNGPRNSWAGSGNGVSMQYLVSTTADSVEIWNIDTASLTYLGNDLATDIPAAAGYYSAGQLYKYVTIDEQAHAVVEYKDKDGLIILKKVQIGTVASDYSGYNGWLSTYYIYDNLNQLRFVLSPKAVRVAYSNNWDLLMDTTTINELCFRYQYDNRLRMSAKKIPGAGWVYMVYDQRDRLVFTQDANMRARNQWIGDPILMGSTGPMRRG